MEIEEMVNNKNIAAGIVVLVCAGALLILLTGSSVPIFNVQELMDHPEPESYIDRKIQIVGNVTEMNATHFTIIDPQVENSGSLFIQVIANNIVKPVGFQVDKTVVVEGKLLSISNIWQFKASMISTKCPSKYAS